MQLHPMSSSLPPDQADVAARLASTLELLAKIGGSLALVLGFLRAAIPPVRRFIEWRRENQARVIREVLKPELARLDQVIEHEDGCAGRMEQVLDRLRQFFADHDYLIAIAIDNRERLNENNDFLDALGFTSRERRSDEDRRKVIDDMVHDLDKKRRARRRGIDDFLDHHPPAPPVDPVD